MVDDQNKVWSKETDKDDRPEMVQEWEYNSEELQTSGTVQGTELEVCRSRVLSVLETKNDVEIDEDNLTVHFEYNVNW